jgi:PKD domain/FG-GAP-like repeat
MKRSSLRLLGLSAVCLVPASARAGGWQGLVDRSDELQTDVFAFNGNHPDMINSNENYYDGDLADFDRDGWPDRALGARYGLLLNTGDGLMTPLPGYTGFLLRGMPGAAGWGEDAFQWADIDGDLDLDSISGGNGEPLVLQTNRGGRFATAWQLSRSALNIIGTDLEGDGDVDLAVAHAFCSNASCGGPVQFSILVNDGSGTMSEETAARGFAFGGTDFIVGVISGDYDGDGDYDLVLEHGTNMGAEGASGSTELARNDGSGYFALEAIPLPTTCSGFGTAMTSGDIDADGDLDLVLGRCGPTFSGADAVVRHGLGINDGAGNFTNESDARFDASEWLGGGVLTGNNAAMADIDYDGDLDFLSLETEDLGGMHHLQLYLNDGAGNLVYSSEHSHLFASGGQALGADIEVGDLDRDGSIDVWVGIGGDRVRELFNTHVAADGLPADAPRGLQVIDALADQVTLAWDLPTHAVASGHYRVYRAAGPGLHERDRELVAVIGEHHGDEQFSVPITASSPASVLDNPNAHIIFGTLQYTDTTVLAGEFYQYSVAFVGTANTESPYSSETTVVVPAAGGGDAEPPAITIVSPTEQDWHPYPRIVVHLADGGSGVDPASVRVTFDQDLGEPAAGGRAAGEDVSDLAYRLDSGVLVLAPADPFRFADGDFVTMTVTAADMDGNELSAERQFLAIHEGGAAPTAAFASSAQAGAAPFPVDFDASASVDAPGGKLVRYEWYFGDGTTALGRLARHEFLAGGSFEVMLLVRDDDGNVAVATQQVDVEGDPPPCQLGDVQDCYSGAAGTQDVGVCVGGTQQCGPEGWGECIGEVVPSPEDCSGTEDRDCDGDLPALDDTCQGGGSEGVDDTAGGSGGMDTGAATTGDTGDSSGDGSAGANEDGGGCGCTQGSRVGPWWAVVVVAVLRRRRSDR